MRCINCGQTEGEVYQGPPHDHVCADCGREHPYESKIRTACLEHWHNEKNAWAYVVCDCQHCKSARKLIALREIGKAIDTMEEAGRKTPITLLAVVSWLELTQQEGE